MRSTPVAIKLAHTINSGGAGEIAHFQKCIFVGTAHILGTAQALAYSIFNILPAGISVSMLKVDTSLLAS